MIKRRLTLMAIALLFSLPTAAIANDINVRVGNVRVNTGSDGEVYVESGRTRVNLDSSSSDRYRSRNRRYCYKYKRHGRYRYKCYSRPRARNYDLESGTIYYPADSRTRRIYCDGNSTYSRQDVSQIGSAGVTVVESSVSSSGCY
jgi:hypothetical protein